MTVVSNIQPSPAKAGIQYGPAHNWTPAFAGERLTRYFRL